MPLRNIRMNFSTRNVQTTAYPTFTTMRRTNPNFSMNTGCCIKSRNPLIGWRKEKVCCPRPCYQQGQISAATPQTGTTSGASCP